MVKEELKTFKQVMEALKKKGCHPPKADALVNLYGPDQKRIFDGACSTMLCTRLAKGDKCWINVRASGFKLPRKNTSPIVMVAAGTGLAPFHAYLREFWAEGGSRNKTILFFGCWRKDEDYIYREEIEEAVTHSPPILTEVITAFSREQSHKVYVQHRFKERAEQIKALVAEDAHFYVCGSTNMGAAIRQELATILGSEDRLKRLQNDGRFYEELW
jgi:NADPH-ferrihemoprotein reductase